MEKKFYIVWKGHHPGIYETWEECKAAVAHFRQPRYKSYKGITREEAEALYSNPPSITGIQPQESHFETDENGIIQHALSVDVGTKGNPGPMEYRGVWVDSKDILFSSKLYPFGTNNIGEFLAIVHAMAWMKQTGYFVPIYSDSLTALYWIGHRKHRSKLPINPQTQELHEVLQRATNWLQNNDLTKYTLLKWDTEQWGEIPADYGRKQ